MRWWTARCSARLRLRKTWTTSYRIQERTEHMRPELRAVRRQLQGSQPISHPTIKFINRPSDPLCSPTPVTTASSWSPKVHASRPMPPGAGLFLQQGPRGDLPRSLQSSMFCFLLLFGGTVPLPSPSAAHCLWSVSNKLLQMLTRKASLAPSLTWRVALIHSPSQSNSLMYHFQSRTSHIQLSSSFEVSQHLPPPSCTARHSLGSSLCSKPIHGGAWAGPPMGSPEACILSLVWRWRSAPLHCTHIWAEGTWSSSRPSGDGDSSFNCSVNLH